MMFAGCLNTSDLTIFSISFELNLKVLALSDIIVLGTPLRAQNFLNACRKTEADNSLVSSKCTPLVDEDTHICFDCVTNYRTEENFGNQKL